MAKKLSYERYLWFHGKLKKGRYPKLSDMEEYFEISHRQAAREVEFMRDFFKAPIEYSVYEKGYFYSDHKFELPGLWTSDEEIITLLIAKKLSGMIPDVKRKEKFTDLIGRILKDTGMDVKKLEKHFSVKNVRYSKVIPSVFESVLLSFIKEQKLRINYHSPYSGSKGERTISPLHLILYMGNWHLIAYCDMKNDVRDFLLSRIKDVEILNTLISEEIRVNIDKTDIYKNYGIFFGGSGKEVILKFSNTAKEMIRDQVWFPGQKLTEDDNGYLFLSFPASDNRELVGDILRFGSDVEVISPDSLRKDIKSKIDEMKILYKD